jgi:hypothetical protein
MKWGKNSTICLRDITQSLNQETFYILTTAATRVLWSVFCNIKNIAQVAEKSYQKDLLHSSETTPSSEDDVHISKATTIILYCHTLCILHNVRSNFTWQTLSPSAIGWRPAENKPGIPIAQKWGENTSPYLRVYKPHIDF